MLWKPIVPRAMRGALLAVAVLAVAACSRPTPATGGVETGGADAGGAGEQPVNTVEPNPIYGDYTTPLPTEEGLPYPPPPTPEPVIEGYPAPADADGDAASPTSEAAHTDGG